MQILIELFPFVALIYSIIIHEYAHGWMADQLGDPTAKHSGRLTLNPIPHIDLMGSIFLPLLLIISNSGFIIGWAKPVPFNPYNLKDQKYGPLKIALAGPAANLVIALFFGMLLRFFPMISSSLNLPVANLTIFIQLIAFIVQLNLLLMIFNLLPIPPLDGSKVLLTFLPDRYKEAFYRFERFGIIILFVSIFFLFDYIIIPILNFLFRLIVG
ncbi:site-2 protease family protein [Candidatus Parcubacteria bacterium]|nr:site-2 protease family protein [Candidatus Parcubacteria bacterium]